MKRSKENNLHARPLQVQERNTNLQKHNGNEQKKKERKKYSRRTRLLFRPTFALLHRQKLARKNKERKNLQGKIKKGGDGSSINRSKRADLTGGTYTCTWKKSTDQRFLHDI